MKNSITQLCLSQALHQYISVLTLLLCTFGYVTTNAQCNVTSGQIKGAVFNDINNNGAKSIDETGIQGILVQAYGKNGALLSSSNTDANGNYTLTGLPDGEKIRVNFSYLSGYYSGVLGVNNASEVQFVTSPACNVDFGLTSDLDVCNNGTEIITTCFVQGETTLRPAEPTIVGVAYGFNTTTPARKFAMHGETGSIWGLAYRSKTNEIFSASFIKQYSGLRSGHDAIFKSSFNGGMFTSSLFVKLSNLGQDVGTLSTTDVTDCNYGAQVGKMGLGSMVISPDEQYLYVVNIYNNTLVRIQIDNPTAANTVNYQIPGSNIHAFALKYYNGKIYAGTTEPGKKMYVWEFDPKTGVFTDTGLVLNAGSNWTSSPVVGGMPAFWLTDIDFSDKGDMLLSLSDRIGHVYCNNVSNRLDEQRGDLMIAFKNNSGGWTLEDRSHGGEFFGDDYWIANPTYHPEITTGSIFAMPGTGSVVSTVFDPEMNSYSGGLHRYSTTTGKKLGSKELYTRNTQIVFGKATGFGEVIPLCGLPDIEIGNLVWLDTNKNGIQDADESGMQGLKVILMDDKCNVLANTITDGNGNYAFNRSNVAGGILRGQQYYIGIDPLYKDAQSGLFLIGGQYYNWTTIVSGSKGINSVAGTTSCADGVAGVLVTGTSHNFDLGLVEAGNCSLKITKKVVNAPGLKYDDIVNFEIEIVNKGTKTVRDVQIEDILPSSYYFNQSLNPNWIYTGTSLKSTFAGNILPDTNRKIQLFLKFNGTQSVFPNYQNEVKVVSINDVSGKAIDNIIICFDRAEDSYAFATPGICDLALTNKSVQGIIYAPDNKAVIKATVYNQGTMDATGFQVVNYLNPEFDFDPATNSGWTISGDLSKLYYGNNTILRAGETRDIVLNLTIKDPKNVSQIINYAEISAQVCGNVRIDFDSNPDDNKDNDKGGIANSQSDDLITDNGSVDEDDHDPAMILVSNIDVRLKKSVANHRVKPGDYVDFNITIINSGTNGVSKIKLLDYLPDYMKLSDSNWKLVDGVAERELTFDGNLQPGQSFETTIRTIISKNAPLPLKLVNIAAIRNIYDEFGKDVSNVKFDDNTASLPEGPGDIQELPDFGNSYDDDYDLDYVLLFPPIEVVSCSACRTATTPENGQFVATFKIVSAVGDGWYVESSHGMYDITSSLPPAAPLVLADGTLLAETPIAPDNVFSTFTLSAIHLDGQSFAIRFRNAFGDLEQVEVAAGTCTFLPLVLKGKQSLCESARAEYKVEGAPNGTSYSWYVDGNLLSGVSGNTHTIDWTGYSVGNHEIKVVANTSDCIAPAVLNVALGAPDLSEIACVGDFNVSLGKSCTLVITPSMLVAGNLNPSAPYVVLVRDMHGNLIPNATLTKEHIGTMVMATLQEGCGGNSCWSNITVEDKIAPVSICRDIVLPCYKLDQYKGPFEYDNCSSIVNNIIVDEKVTRLDCNSNFVMFVDRTYQATDESGNKSALCKMRISLQRPDLDKIIIPANFTMLNGNPLTCQQFVADEKGIPTVAVTGVPTLDGISLYPDFENICNLSVWYEDEDLGYIGCVRKIVRSWYVYEAWCSTNDVIVHKQMIEIIDNESPSIKALSDITVSTNGQSFCEAVVPLPPAYVTDGCSGIYRVDVTYPGGFISDYKNNSSITLSAGSHLIKYTVYDNCKNSSSTTFIIHVEDKTAPTVVCKGIVVVGLDTKGNAYLFPKNVDDGSFDGCGISYMKIARMGSNPLLPDSLFKEYIQFDCGDIGQTNIVVLKVWDVNGNSNSCMVNVEVQDKHKPVITCPADITIDCSAVFTGMDLTQYGKATVFDACGAEMTELEPVFTLSACRTGTIVRTFSGTDGVNTVTCKQTITVENSNIFDPERDVVFPKDYAVNNKCSAEDLDPENLPDGYGYPVITQAACGLAAATYRDYTYDFIKNACYKIVRKWTVIDWCEMERLGSNYVPYEYQQVIVVTNTESPFFISEEPRDTTFYTDKGNCEEGRVTLTFVGKDLCTPDDKLRWRYVIDFYNDNIHTDDVIDNGYGNTASLNALLPVGTHRITWSFEDQCGNIVTKTHLVTVVNNDKPLVVSVERISISVIPWDTDGDGEADVEMSCIVAATLDKSSESICCTEPLKFSFSSDVNDTIRCFTCYHVGYPTQVELWATDCNGNQDYTIVDVDVQDNNDSDVCEKICENFPAVAVISGPTSICEGETVVLTASGSVTYLWSTGETTSSITVNPAVTTTYSVTVTNEFRCVDETSITLVVNKYPVGQISGSNVCLGESTTLTASGGAAYEWNTGETTASIDVDPITKTTYTVSITSAEGCQVVLSKEVDVYPLPVVTISGNNFICIGSSTDLTASGGSNYLWSTGATTSTITVSPVQTTTYTVTVTDVNGCTAEASIVVQVNGLSISASITGDNEICQGESTTLQGVLNGGTATSYLWSTGAVTSSITVSPGTSTTYTVTITDSNGCTAAASRLVTVRSLPQASITGPDGVCIGSTATLTASGGVSYLWSTGATTASITVSPSSATTYTVTVTNSFGCVSTASKVVSVNPLPIVNISGNTSICINEETTLTASGGVTYIWSTGATTSSITVSPSVSTTYSVTATDSNGCKNSASILVTVNGLTINASITGDDIICSGESTVLTGVLTGGTAASYLWSTGATTQSITVSPTSNTNYSVTIQDINGCNGTASKLVTVQPLPLAAITGPDAVCIGSSATLTASGGVSYLWSTGATTASITVTPTSATTYFVTVTNSFGCVSTASKVVSVNQLPIVNINGNTSICINEETTLTASGGVSYIWSTGATTASITVSPPVSTTYSVTATDANGCSNVASILVTVNGLTIQASIIGADTICTGTSTVLTAVLNGGTAVSYIWSTGETTSSITVTPAQATSYSVTIQDTNGCNGSASKTVELFPLPVILITGDNQVCINDSITLTATGAITYVWSTGETTASIVVDPVTSTIYSVTGTDSRGCINTAQITVDVLPLPNISIVGVDSVCANTQAILSAIGGVSYVWSTGETTSSITVIPSTSTTYSVTGTDSNGCKDTAEHTVNIYPQDSIGIIGELNICAGDTVTYSAFGGVKYEWSTGATTPSIQLVLNDTTTIWVIVVDGHSCRDTAYATINVDQGDLVCSTQDITVYLDGTGTVTIDPEDISTGHIGACSNISAFVTPNVLNCNDATLPDPVVVTLTVVNETTHDTLTCTALVTVLDTLKPSLICPSNVNISCDVYDPTLPLSSYGNAIVTDNCLVQLQLDEESIIDVNECNVGLITRTFTATDFSGNSSQCVQLITVFNDDPMTIDDINFPDDVTITDCDSTDPSSIGFTDIDTGQFKCGNIDVSYVDNIPPSLCEGQFERTWTVVDSCQLETGTNNGIWSHVQNITVQIIPPVISGPDTIYIYRDSTTCEAKLEGNVLHTVTGCNLTFYVNGTVVNDFNLNGDYTDGEHDFELVAVSNCDTTLRDSFRFVLIVVGVEEHLVCVKTYPELDGSLTVDDFVADHVRITQGCPATAKIIASFSNVDITDTVRTYTCADLPFSPIGINIYFWYEGASAPYTLCNSLVGLTNIYAPFCPDSITLRVDGDIKTAYGEVVPGVEVQLLGSGLPNVKSGSSGHYEFPPMQGGGTYDVIPERNTDPLDGVSTLDLVYMQRHILDLEPLDSPYKVIAADVNNDERITAQDISQLRKLILGVYDHFPNNTSWRMVDRNYVFPEIKDPFLEILPENYHIPVLGSNMNINWVGIKTGDVNDSYQANGMNYGTEKRSVGLYMNFPDQTLNKGKNIIPVYADKDIEMAGFQLALSVMGAREVYVIPAKLSIYADNFSYSDNVLKISWNKAEIERVSSGDILFYIHAEMENEMNTANAIYLLSDNNIRPEFYGKSLKADKLGLRVIRDNSSTFEIHGNVPNPWNNETQINFYLPKSGEVNVRITDVTGKVVYMHNENFKQGENTLRISSEDIGVTGMLLYELKFGGQVKTGKMLNIR
ncbi:MAG TPA: SdrD B-like domain-containing protein [Saprospiraceae bacterium]|mgnify:CR=1 FL=1|nr:DUF11 domain-containing protein [Saprospiraceae bacterium]HRO08393.1 SdrD B-like domain-containing protein [Saprospiraceae bacterium]HRP41778.1 SdrD B-like domain-containing protein [Saprospiraceae bacterium]